MNIATLFTTLTPTSQVYSTYRKLNHFAPCNRKNTNISTPNQVYRTFKNSIPKKKKNNRTNHNNWSIRAASFARSSGNTTARLSHCCWSFSRTAIAHTGTWVTALARANGQTVGLQTWENYQLFPPKKTTLDVHKHLIANITPFPPKKPSIWG